jgi:hypothetical protein
LTSPFTTTKCRRDISPLMHQQGDRLETASTNPSKRQKVLDPLNQR